MLKIIKKFIVARRMKKEGDEVQRIAQAIHTRIEDIADIVVEKLFNNNFSQDIAMNLDSEGIAMHVDVCDVAQEINVSEVADNVYVEASDIAYHMDISEVASYLDLDELAHHVEVDEGEIASNFCVSDITEALGICSSDVAAEMDILEVAQEAVNFMDVSSVIEDKVFEIVEVQISEMRDAIMDDVINEITDRLSGIGESE